MQKREKTRAQRINIFFWIEKFYYRHVEIASWSSKGRRKTWNEVMILEEEEEEEEEEENKNRKRQKKKKNNE